MYDKNGCLFSRFFVVYFPVINCLYFLKNLDETSVFAALGNMCLLCDKIFEKYDEMYDYSFSKMST